MHDWVNLSKGGGNDRVFPGLAGLLQGIFRGQSPRGNPNPVLPDSFTQIYILFLIGLMGLLKCINCSVMAFLKSTDGSVLALQKPVDGSVLALLRLPSIFSHQNVTVGEFLCTMAIMKEKQQNFIFEIEWFILRCSLDQRCCALHRGRTIPVGYFGLTGLDWPNMSYRQTLPAQPVYIQGGVS